MKLKIYQAALSAFGASLLFASWIDQQYLYSKWSSALSSLASTESVVHSYKAADSVIRAVGLAASDIRRNDGDTLESRLQNNFNRAKSFTDKFVSQELYMEHLERLPKPTDNGVRPAYLDRIHNQYNALHNAIAQERSNIAAKKDAAEFFFLLLYILGTLAVVSASILKYHEARQEAKSAA